MNSKIQIDCLAGKLTTTYEIASYIGELERKVTELESKVSELEMRQHRPTIQTTENPPMFYNNITQPSAKYRL